MHFEQLNQSGWAKTYLLVDSDTQMAALVDPVYDFMNEYLALIETRNLSLHYAIATHTHADHISACSSLRERTGCEYVMWKDTACLKVSKYLQEGEALMLGSTPLKIHHVPGHTNDHVLIEGPSHLLTGDFLFTGQGGVGRDDLPSGELFSHWESLKKLEQLDGTLLVCTGHEAPGTIMQTLAWNRTNNPVLKMTTFEQFETWQKKVTADLGSVSKIKTALPANLFAEIPDVIPWME
ncbi:MAG: MBL fold metallo-hydrolase [Candidatus Poseidoniaceae archaeon]|nr:MBL fold metallo-hydrolase [Candidatus Poseidoniaceae archaeon]